MHLFCDVLGRFVVYTIPQKFCSTAYDNVKSSSIHLYKLLFALSVLD